MSKTIITAENLGKLYMIGHQKQGSYSTLRDVVTNLPRQWWSRIRNPQYHNHENLEEFWALKDVSFEINQGDRVGIIGRNGAGKSTLLKILSRITEPTTGRVKIKGRVASLLEVGTGFHPELTGRENIFLNGAILGMSRAEVKKKFDEIVDFAEVEKFLDTPVKRYSSGMYVRLAFAVAAHLEPEILVVDEVLAVGDSQFQKKCLGKMEDVGREGRTVLFVSHNMTAVESLCQKGILIENGQIITQGNSTDVITNYLSGSEALTFDFDLSNIRRNGSLGKNVRFIKGSTLNSFGKTTKQYRLGEEITICMDLLSTHDDHEQLHVNVGINTIQQQVITTVTNRTSQGLISCLEGEIVSLKVVISNLTLSSGAYNLTIVVGRRGQLPLDMLQGVLAFTVNDTLAGSQVVPHPNLPGFVQATSEWSIETHKSLS